jgi:transketolase
MPKDNLVLKWKSFGWKVIVTNGHSDLKLKTAFKAAMKNQLKPVIILAHCIKGKSIKLVEGHGNWHHKIPNSEEYNVIRNGIMKQ